MNEVLDKILNVMENTKDDGLTVVQICKETGLGKDVVLKNLNILLASGKVKYKFVGKVKLWYAKKKSANVNVKVAYSSEMNEKKLAKILFDDLRKQVKSPKLILLFASTHINLQSFLNEFVNKFDKNTRIVGTTTAGEFSNLHCEDDTVVALAFDSDHIDIGVGVGKDLSLNGFKAGETAAKNAYNNIEMTMDLYKRIPDSIETLLSFQNSFALTFPDGFSGKEEQAIKGIVHTYSKNCSIFGASSGNDLKSTKTYQFVGNKVYSDAILVILFVTDVKLGFMNDCGWRVTNNNVFVTKSNGRVIYELDNQRASKVYAKHVGVEEEELLSRQIGFDIGNQNPFGIADLNGDYWLKHPAFVYGDGSILCFSNIPERVSLNIMDGSVSSLLDSTRKALCNVKKQVPEPAFGMVFNCVSRKKFLGDSGIQKEHEILKKELNCPFIGFYCIGEQGFTKMGVTGHRNQSINICLVSKNVVK